MHMADALVSPVVGGSMWAASAGLIGYSCKRVKADLESIRTPLMGVMAAFVFAAEMVNFAIPATGSSGHLGGGLLLAILLGPHAGFLTMASVLIVQAVFFADGGLLSLGCNIFNLGFFPCFVAYPFVYKPLARLSGHKNRLALAALAAAVVGLQLGAAGVVLETRLSGIAELPLLSFALLMQPIHLAIGVAEGLATAAVVLFVARARPELLDGVAPSGLTIRRLLVAFAVAGLVLGAGVSWFASTRPDGLEWAVGEMAGDAAVGRTGHLHDTAAAMQRATAILPDYGFTGGDAPDEPEPWPVLSRGTTVSGIVGGVLTLLLALALGLGLGRKKRPAPELSPKNTA
jgi:cobalt/nickel transport system permease protein